MQKMSFTAENKKVTMADYPKLKLGVNERARILCIEEPIVAYVHNLRAPIVVNGQAKMTTAKRNNGEEYETYAFDFIGRPLCLGDEGVIEDKGIDPKNCPACALASESDMAKPPERRFAMHVIRYSIRQGGDIPTVATPFSVQLLAWSYPDSVFNKIVDIATEWGDLKQHDLLLGPCKPPVEFQKFDIGVAAKAAWMEPDQDGVDRKTLVVTTFRENKADDLGSFCGRKVDSRFMAEDVDKIRARWRVVNGQPAADGTESVGALTAGLDELLNEHPGGVDEFAPKTAGSGASLSSLLDEDTLGRPVADTPAAAPSLGASATEYLGSPEKAASPAALSFDDLFATVADVEKA
jgi:hypothetical protein